MTDPKSADSNPELDQALEEYLAGDSEISQQYDQQAQEQTPAELDKLVLAAAHKKTGAAKPSARSVRRPRRWLQPLAGVAVLVLGLALTLDLLQDQSIVPEDKQLPKPATENRNRLDPQPSTESATVNKLETDTGQATASKAQSRSTAPAQEQDSEEPEALAPNREQADTPEPPEPPPPRIEDEPIQAPPIPAQVTPPAPQESAPESAPEPIEQAPRQSAPGPSQSPGPQPSARPEPALEPYSGPPLPQAPPASAQTPSEPAYRETPQTWIRHIVFLADTGQSDLARTELRKYRERHPQARVPAELEQLEGTQ